MVSGLSPRICVCFVGVDDVTWLVCIGSILLREFCVCDCVVGEFGLGGFGGCLVDVFAIMLVSLVCVADFVCLFSYLCVLGCW